MHVNGTTTTAAPTTERLLSCDEFAPLWISRSEGHIRVGRGLTRRRRADAASGPGAVLASVSLRGLDSPDQLKMWSSPENKADVMFMRSLSADQNNLCENDGITKGLFSGVTVFVVSVIVKKQPKVSDCEAVLNLSLCDR